MGSYSCAGPQEGFSLVETLVATIVLGVGLVGMIHGITAVLEASQVAENYSRAVFLAAEQMELLGAEGTLRAGEFSGDFGAELPRYRWRSTVRESRGAGLFEVTVTVLAAPAEEPLYELTTLVFVAPEESPALPGAGGIERGAAARGGAAP
ncbi:MAG: prepilin-type N-terminal cleavage/methylation domain-containing protein [Planctomycetes bacterium]|nr:prepilin-type N-terminal cleavage/methylation domain-containing protein [Planctomycetota bacterium]